MTVHIPEWLLWALGLGLGIPLVLSVFFLAFMGIVFFRTFKDFRLW